MRGHVHLFLSAPPRHTPAKLVNIIKSISRNEILYEFLHLSGRCCSRKLWTDGYSIASR
ncbi:hypothetical protein CEE35_00470 [Candidatus Aerophobetes bacterium Ae_b3b]|nr:MAG: hypothetical protein CEE35_00470 [Candidatus Aerophobetes bacterium Ae_b3b]